MAEKSFLTEKKDKSWFENFWYYYNRIIIAGIAVIIFVICLCVSCNRRINYDLEIAWFSGETFDSSVMSKLADEIVPVVDDADGEDGVNVFCHPYYYDMYAEGKTEVDMTNATKIQLEITDGYSYLYIMSEDWYEYILNYQVLADISEYTGDTEPVYGIEITDNQLIKSLGFEGKNKLYAGVRRLEPKRAEKEVYQTRYNSAIKAIQYILQKQFD